jgi:hypothetical protein
VLEKEKSEFGPHLEIVLVGMLWITVQHIMISDISASLFLRHSSNLITNS